MDRRTLLQLAGVTGLGALAPSMLASCGGGGADGISGITLASSDVAFGAGDVALVDEAVRGMSTLGAQLLGRLGGTPGNLAISPYSVAMALGMTVNGARSTTREEMLTVLGARDTADLNEGLAALIRHLDGLAGEKENIYGKKVEVALDTANSLFGQADTTWRPGFLDSLKRSYDAGMRMVDYRTDYAGARRLINEWVSSRTHDRIPTLIPEGVLDALTRLVLVNALYFKAPWLHQFEKDTTRPGPFHLAGGGSVEAQLMRALVERVRYAENDTWQAVRLPYVGGGLAMTVVLPRPGSFDRVWRMVVSGEPNRLLAVGEPRAVDLTLPRWTFRSQSALTDPLVSLGMGVAFDPDRADLSGMTTEEKLYLTAVVHEVWIAVDEEGTEAAAATGVVAGTTSMPISVPMVVDRPFLFVIHDTTYLTPLFVGRVMDPTQV